MEDFWLVAADASRARFFEGDSPKGTLREIDVLENEDARKYDSELNTDRPGKSDDPSAHKKNPGMGRSAFGESERGEELLDRFAAEVAEKLRKAHASGDFDQFALVAAPEFLGRVRDKLDSHLQEILVEDVAKNVTDADAEQIQSYLSKPEFRGTPTPTKPPMSLGARFERLM